MTFVAPKLILSVAFADANNLLAGVMNLKGFKVFKSKSNDDCLSIISQVQEKTDAVLIDKQSAVALITVRHFGPSNGVGAANRGACIRK